MRRSRCISTSVRVYAASRRGRCSSLRRWPRRMIHPAKRGAAPMSDYTAFSGDQRAPLTRAFVDAFRRAMETRDALGRATEAPLEVHAPGENVADKVAAQLAS